MRESRTYGFVRGAHSDMRPYRDTNFCLGIFLFSVAVQGYAATLTLMDDFNWPQSLWCFSGVK
jgi:hypothetical protein